LAKIMLVVTMACDRVESPTSKPYTPPSGEGETRVNDRRRSPALATTLVRVIVLTIAVVVITSCAPQANQTSEAGQAGRVVRLGIQQIAQTDPALISSDSEVLIANQVYDYLVDIDAQNRISPRLATDWSVSPDGLTYTFNLARGVSFHDGSPLTAEDVVWTFNRLRDPASGYPTADLYSEITDIHAFGDDQVVFTLAKTNPFFLFDLSDNHALILDSATNDPSKDFNGTGPFKVVEYVPPDRITMEANPDYFKGAPRVDGLEVTFFSDISSAVEALQGGQIDFVMGLSTPQYDNLRQAAGVQTQIVKTNAFVAIRLRMDETPGDDPRVIRALNLATDREALFDVVQRGYGSVGGSTPIGPLYTDYYDPSITPPARDPQAARDLLDQAGYPDGLRLDMYMLNTGNFPDLGAALKAQWAEAGIDVALQLVPESVYYGEGKWLDVNLGITGWAHRPYPQFYLDVMLVCGAKWNESHFCDPEFDRLADIAGTTLDEPERVAAYREIQHILTDRGPLIVPYFFAQFAATSENLHGLELKPFPGRTDFRTASLSQ
jgi:peptide/nickel transport system substrate-binding protein